MIKNDFNRVYVSFVGLTLGDAYAQSFNKRPCGLKAKSPIVDWLRGAHACMDLATSWRPFGPFHLATLMLGAIFDGDVIFL